MDCLRWALAMVMGGLVGCASDDGLAPAGAGDRFGPGYPPGSAAWKAGARAAYRTAFMAGMQDQKDGYRYDDDRGALALDVEDRGFYRQGYRRGYYRESTLKRQEQRAAGTADGGQEAEGSGQRAEGSN